MNIQIQQSKEICQNCKANFVIAEFDEIGYFTNSGDETHVPCVCGHMTEWNKDDFEIIQEYK